MSFIATCDRRALHGLFLVLVSMLFLQAESHARAQCSYILAFDGQLVSKAAGNFAVGVTAGAGCAWTAASNDSWITVTSGSSGSGNGTVAYSVNANSGGTRTGTLTIAGATFYVFQSASTPNCEFLFVPHGVNNLPASGGSFNFAITGATQTECSWTATSNAGWVTITSGASGNGNATVSYSVAANGTGSNRTAQITVTGLGGVTKIYSIKQLW